MIGFYLDQAGPRPIRLLFWLTGNLRSFPVQLTKYLSLYPNPDSILHSLINIPVALTFTALTALGAISLFRQRGIRYWDVYAAIYLVTVLVYSLLKARYLIPLVPLLSIYTFQGIRVTSISTYAWFSAPVRKKPLFRLLFQYRYLYPVLICAPLFLAYWTAYTFRPVTTGANIFKQPDLQDLFQAVQDPAYGIQAAIFHHPRVLSLMTGVPATTCFNAEKYWQQDVIWDLPKLLDLSVRSKISHVILDREQSATWQALYPVMAAHPQHFERIYSNSGYDIYRILHD